MRAFLKFSLIWYSQQFAIPFWVVGHVHLHLTDYHQVVELLMSIAMHAAVAVGFWLDWVQVRDGASLRQDGSTNDCIPGTETEAE